MEVEGEVDSDNYISVNKYVKYEVNLNMDESVDWYVDISVGNKFGRGVDVRVDIDVGAEVGNDDYEVVELLVLDAVGSRYGRSADKVVKGLKYGVGVGVGGSIGWVVDSGIGAGFEIANGTTFSIDDGYDMGSSDSFFDFLNDGKPVG